VTLSKCEYPFKSSATKRLFWHELASMSDVLLASAIKVALKRRFSWSLAEEAAGTGGEGEGWERVCGGNKLPTTSPSPAAQYQPKRDKRRLHKTPNPAISSTLCYVFGALYPCLTFFPLSRALETSTVTPPICLVVKTCLSHENRKVEPL